MRDGQGSGVEKEISHFSQEVLKERVMHFITFSAMIILSISVAIMSMVKTVASTYSRRKKHRFTQVDARGVNY